MRVVPRPLVERVQFFETHLVALTANATRIGTTPEDVALLRARTDAARAAYDAQQEAQLTARSATLAFNLAVEAMSRLGAGIIGQVGAAAQSTSDGDVYVLASLPAPRLKSRVGPPGTPMRLRATLDGRGGLTLAWACPNPRGSKGTIYEIDRRDGTHGPFRRIGISGTKRFADASVPAGAGSVTYRIRGVRSTREGVWAEFNVRLGTDARTPALFRPAA